MGKKKLLSGVSAPNGAPTASTDGVKIGDLQHVDEAAIWVKSTAATAGTAKCKLRVWLKSNDSDINDWFPAGAGAAQGDPGVLNEGFEIVETEANSGKLRHLEVIRELKHTDEIFIQVVSITDATIDVFLTSRGGRY